MLKVTLTLADVESAVQERDRGPRYFEGMLVHVCNFEPIAMPWPHGFTYNGCTVPTRNGRVCSKSIDSVHGRCQIHPHSKLHSAMYRFKLYLVDASMGGRALRAMCFNKSAHELLLISATALDGMGELEQLQYVSQMIRGMSMCEVTLKVVGGDITIQTLKQVPFPSPLSPPCASKSPATATLSICTSESSGGRGKGQSRLTMEKYFEEHEKLTQNVNEALESFKLQFLTISDYEGEKLSE